MERTRALTAQDSYGALFFFLPEINIVNRSLSGERNRCVIELK